MIKNKIRLLIFVKSIDGGTGTYVFQLLKLKKLIKNLIIDIVCLESPSFRQINKYLNKFTFYHYENYYPQIYNFSLKNLFNFIQEFFWIKKQINKFSPNIVLGIDLHCNLIISIIRLFNKKFKTILTSHINLINNIEERSDCLLKFILRRAVSFFYNKVDSLIFVSKELANDFVKSFVIKEDLIEVIYNGIEIKPILNSRFNNFNKKIVITLARLVEQKDYLTLFEAFKLIIKNVPHAKLTVLSRGLQEKEIKKLAEKIGIIKNVEFLGWVKNIYKYLTKSTVFVLSSKREGFGYAIIEAMNAGLPIISTNTYFGPSEILDHGKYGLLTPVGDEKSLSKAIYILLTDEKKYNYYAQKSLERVRYFSLDKMLNAYKKVILDLVNKP